MIYLSFKACLRFLQKCKNRRRAHLKISENCADPIKPLRQKATDIIRKLPYLQRSTVTMMCLAHGSHDIQKGSLDRKIGQGSPFYIDSSCFPAYSFHRNITICALVHLLPTPNRSLPIPSAMLSCAAPCHSGCVVGIRCDITEPGTATCSGAAHRKVKSLSTPLHPWLRPSQHKRILLRNSR